MLKKFPMFYFLNLQSVNKVLISHKSFLFSFILTYFIASYENNKKKKYTVIIIKYQYNISLK